LELEEKEKKTLKFQLKLEPPWPSNKLGTGRMKEKECDPNASLARYQVCNQKNEKNNLRKCNQN
jgi:hypothetical protein